jgi:hypothetical protein
VTAFSAALGVAAAQPAGAARWGVEQVRKSSTATWPRPSPAPTGLTYDGKSKKLLVSDAEVDEGPLWQGRNLFVVARKGDLRAARQLVGATNEPEGISWYGGRKVLFVAGDARTAIFRFGRGPDRKIGTGDDTVLRLLETERWGSFDPEGVTFRAEHGRVNMLIWSDAGMGSGNANAIFKVKRGQDQRFGTEDDVMSTFSTSAPPFGYAEASVREQVEQRSEEFEELGDPGRDARISAFLLRGVVDFGCAFLVLHRCQLDPHRGN